MASVLVELVVQSVDRLVCMAGSLIVRRRVYWDVDVWIQIYKRWIYMSAFINDENPPCQWRPSGVKDVSLRTYLRLSTILC